ncbi:hypothetical protein ABK040_012495 [Willaertia magna]
MKRTNSENDKISNKEVKLMHDNSKISFTQLPTEVIHQIICFLSGSTKFDEFDFFSIRSKEELEVYILPLENIKTLNNLVKYTSKDLCDNLFLKTFMSDKSNKIMKDKSQKEEENNNAELSLFEKHWLNCYNFQEILLYWIRTSGLDNLQLGTGDISITEMIEMCKIQNLIQCKERGKIMSELKEAENRHYYKYNEGGIYDVNISGDSSEKKKDTVPFNNKDKAQQDLKKRFKRLALNEKDYYLQQQQKGNNIFDLFIFKSLILSLGVNEYFDCDRKKLWVNSKYLLPSEKIDQWIDNIDEIDYSTSEWRRENNNNISSDSLNNKVIGLSIEDPLGWERFITNTKFTLKHERMTKRKSEKLNEEEKEQISLGPMLTESELSEKFSNFIFLNLKNIAFFGEQFKNYTFPNSIQILSLYFDSHNFYNHRPKEEWNNLFENVTFPNVKYLRIFVDESIYQIGYFEEEKCIDGDDLKSLILKRLLQKNRFPKLNHLVLNEIARNNNLEECDKKLIKQLMTIEVKFARECEEEFQDIFESIKRLNSQLLKYVVIQTPLCVRDRGSVSFNELQDFYSESSFVF